MNPNVVFTARVFTLSSVSDPRAEYIGTEPWKPKEVLEEQGEITDRADIFAYGLTLWEMMTLTMPHVDLLGDDVEEDEGETLWPLSITLLTPLVDVIVIHKNRTFAVLKYHGIVQINITSALIIR